MGNRTIQVLKRLLKEFPEMQEKFGDLTELAAEQVESARKSVKAQKRTVEDMDAEIRVWEERLEKMQAAWSARPAKVVVAKDAPEEQARCGKWRKWKGTWTPRPLGVE